MYIYKKLFFIFPISVFICSCSNNEQTKTAKFKELNDSVTISNNELKTQNDSLYKILEQKLQNEKTAQAAVLWYPKAKYLQYRTDEICKYLETAISNLTTDSVLNNPDTLYERLNFYKGNILRIDPDIYKAINKDATVITHYFDSVKQNTSDRFDLIFLKKSKEEQLLILNRTLTSIEAIENKTLLFCNSKIE